MFTLVCIGIAYYFYREKERLLHMNAKLQDDLFVLGSCLNKREIADRDRLPNG